MKRGEPDTGRSPLQVEWSGGEGEGCGEDEDNPGEHLNNDGETRSDGSVVDTDPSNTWTQTQQYLDSTG